jgi:4-hydroxy-3-polyprenylbenzoate decarboxylase
VYGVRLLQVLAQQPGVETHLVVSRAAWRTLELELPDWKREAVEALADRVYDPGDLAAAISSGSFLTAGMVIAPCSMKTLAAVAHGFNEDLISRAADVTLKERRRLVLVPREAPLHLGHLRNMVAVAELGAVIVPPLVAFYHAPRTLMDVVDHTIGKVLDILGLEHSLFQRWQGPQER